MNDSNDSSHSIDINSLVNVILPLDLIKYNPFPSEISFDRLRHLIHDYLSNCNPSNSDNLIISPAFLFSICTTLWNDTHTHIGTMHESVLPSVLKRLRWWRVLPSEERCSEEVIEKLAMDLASFVNSWGAVEDEDTGLRWMRIRWIGADSEYTEFHATGTRTSIAEERAIEGTSEVSDPVLPAIPRQHRPFRSSLGHTCVNTRPPEETEFRSGCCTCRTPRHSETHRRVVSAPINQSPSSRSSYTYLSNPPSAAPAVPALPTLAQTDPPIIKSNGKDENIPPFPAPASRNLTKTRTHSKSASVPAVQLPPPSITKQSLRAPSVASSRPTRVIKLPANPPLSVTKSRNPSLSRLSTSTSTSDTASLSTSSQVISRKSVTLSSRPPFGVSTRINTQPPLSSKPDSRPKIPTSSNRNATIPVRAPKPRPEISKPNQLGIALPSSSLSSPSNIPSMEPKKVSSTAKPLPPLNSTRVLRSRKLPS